MILSSRTRFASKVILNAAIFCLVLPGILIGPGLGTAEAKTKVTVRARCCPLEVIIVIKGGANARMGAPNGEASLEGNKLTLELNSSDNRKEYVVDKETGHWRKRAAQTWGFSRLFSV